MNFNLKELQKLISLCRKSGVTSIKLEGVELTLSDEAPMPAKPRGKTVSTKRVLDTTAALNPQDLEAEMTPDQLLMWSSNYTDYSETGEQ